MSRNKAILLVLLVVIIYFAVPNNALGLQIKLIIVRLAAAVLAFMLIYGIVMLNMLKRAMRRLAEDVTEENTISVVKLFRITFDTKRMFGAETIQSLYRQVNASGAVSLEAKQAFYDAIRRKRIEVPPPVKGTKPNASKNNKNKLKKK